MNRFADERRPLALPPRPAPARRPSLPLLATLAPVLAAGLMFAVTHSPLSLMFAAIGPLVGIASLLDGLRGARRDRRRAMRERSVALEELEREIEMRHRDERSAAWRRTPALDVLVGEPPGSRWLAEPPSQLVLGAGTEPSALRLDGEPADERDRELLRLAARLDGAPTLVTLDGGVGFVGPELLARAAARAVVARCAATRTPGEVRIEAPGGAWAWATRLPHRSGERAVLVVDGPGAATPHGAAAVVAVAADRAQLPPGLGAVVLMRSARRAELHELGDPRGGREFVPELLGERQAAEFAVRLDEVARRNALGGAGALPSRVELAGLSQPAPRGRSSLAAIVGVGADGPLELDLVADGPHALVGGTTGSGKSEFLLAWLAALAAAHAPDRLAVLLIDFKGGAAFAPIADLPHVTGIVTDLDEAEAERAVQSLRAESRRRERMLRAHGARDIVELDDSVELARLVIVVDEFQALLDRFAELGDVIADIAARGRSLGMHLVLATQRPNGVVREQISANCRLRVCLRVLQPGDSRAVVGVADAARIPPDRPGRAVVDRGDGEPGVFQSALADPVHLELLRAAHATARRARRPWLDPLPPSIGVRELDDPRRLGAAPLLEASALPIGVLDDPGEQRRSIAAWRPASDGPLLVVGAPGSGTSTALATVAHAFAVRHGPDSVESLPELRSDAWDVLERWAGSPPVEPRLLLVDDLDRVFRPWPDEYRQAGEAMLEAVLRAARAGAGSVAAAAVRQPSIPAALRDGFGAVLALRQPSRADLALLGADPALWRADERAGAGQWRGLRVQLASGALPPPTPRRSDPRLVFRPGAVYACVVTNARLEAERLQRIPGLRCIVLGGGAEASRATAESLALEAPSPGEGLATVIVGDAESWAGAWQLWGAIRQRTTVIVRGGLPELRALVRDRRLPPLLDPGDERGWCLPPGGGAGRIVWPTASGN
ncbi:FtsK/SpoIIIE domain-containing protein [Agromyces soli]